MPPQAEPSGRSRTPLSDYVREYKKRTGVSTNELAARCVDPDNPTRPIYPQWLKALLAARMEDMPGLWRLRALAVGMGAEVDLVKRLAIAQWLEYEVEETKVGDDVIMVPVNPALDEAARRRILRRAELLAQAELEDS